MRRAIVEGITAFLLVLLVVFSCSGAVLATRLDELCASRGLYLDWDLECTEEP